MESDSEEVQVEEVVNKREEKTGGQAGEVHLGVLYFEKHWITIA